MTKITEYLEIILEGRDLTFEQACDLLNKIFEGDVSEVQIAAFLAAMRMKSATADELAGLAKSLRDHAVRVRVKNIDTLVDTCGTGGSPVKTFNVSTAAAIAAAGAGVYIAKHGNKAITSKCGSADVLEALGVNLAPGPEVVAECIEKAHIGFMFAPAFHPAMKFVQPIRKSLDFRTAFNILGPLANPAYANAQVMGVPEEAMMERIAQTLKKLGSKRAMVVHSEGLDEISTLAPTRIFEINEGVITTWQLDPAKLGFSKPKPEQIQGCDPAANAEIIRSVLEGKNTGPACDIVMLNAAAAVIVAGLANDFEDALKLADKSIKTGKAAEALEKLVKISNA